MPPAVKRQRPAVKSKIALSKQQQQQPPTPCINTFTHVSKSIGSSSNIKQEAISTNITTTVCVKLAAITTSARKRKAVAPIQDDNDSSSDEAPVKSTATTTEQSKERQILPAKRGRGRPPKKTRPAPPTLKRSRSPSVSDSDQSTINTDKLFKRLRIESSPSRASSPLTANTSVADSEADSDLDISSGPTLPSEVLSLVDLHASFLKTLTLHYVHNGSHVPADLRVLCPNVARSWGKRAVAEADIRIALGILNMNASKALFSLSDYGRGKICVEIDQSQSSGVLNEKDLNKLFYNNIEAFWSKFLLSSSASDVSRFIDTLPRSEITICDSLAKASMVVEKGQQRLTELRQEMAAKKLEKGTKVAVASASSPLTNPDGTKMSLLDRIKFKQMLKASMPDGLSPEEMQRRAALQRVNEVAALIGMLSRSSSGGMGRISFSMPTMLQKLKDSFRMGISKEDGAACIRVIAMEVAPEWVLVVKINGKENVVVETDRQLSKVQIARRVQDITASF